MSKTTGNPQLDELMNVTSELLAKTLTPLGVVFCVAIVHPGKPGEVFSVANTDDAGKRMFARGLCGGGVDSVLTEDLEGDELVLKFCVVKKGDALRAGFNLGKGADIEELKGILRGAADKLGEAT